MQNKKELVKDYEVLYKDYIMLRQELNIIKGSNSKNQLKKLIN